MKKLALLTAALFCGLVLNSCNKEVDSLDDSTKENTEITGDPTQIAIRLVQPGTRGFDGEEAGTVDESTVKSVEIYVFNSDGTADKQVGNSAASGSPANGNGYVIFTPSAQTDLSRTLMVTAEASAKTVVALANQNPAIGAVSTYADLKNKLAGGAFKADATDGYLSRDESRGGYGFEMTGATTAVINLSDNPVPVYVSMSRLATKILAPTFYADQAAKTGTTGVNIPDEQVKALWKDADLAELVALLADPADALTSILNFTYEGYAVVNGLSRSDVFFTGNATADDLQPWGTWAWASKDGASTPKTYLSSTFTSTTDPADSNYGLYTNNYSGPLGLDATFKPVATQENGYFLDGQSSKNAHRVYVYENMPAQKTVSSVTGADPANTYAFIIKGTLSVTGDADASLTCTRYWRVNLTKSDDYRVYRNTVYHTNIQTITSIGKNTPKDAENNTTVLPGADESAAEIQLLINPWRLYNFNTEM